MRVTAGKYKGRQLKVPSGVIRPCMERMRISLFSTLGNIEGDSMLDLFSGSGIMTAEALSRGAKSSDIVEKDYGKKRTILDNLSFVEEEKRVFIMDVFRFIKKFSAKVSYDIIYIDPPFNFPNKNLIIDAVLDAGFIKENSSILIHYPKEDEQDFLKISAKLEIYDLRKYGRSQVNFIRLRESSVE